MAVTALAALAACLALLSPPCDSALTPDGFNSPVDAVKAKYREQLRAVADEMARRYENLDALMAKDVCGCSYHVCGSKFAEGQCLYIPRDGTVASLPSWFQPFFNCGLLGPCDHHLTYMEDSVVWTPSHVITEDPDLSSDVIEDICMTKGLEETLKPLANYTGQFVFPMYFAHARSGVLRQWPLAVQLRTNGVCRQFDPRDKQWYKVATSEPKNVVIIVETSSTMATKLFPGAAADSKSRWDVANATVRGILETLDRISDSVNVVAFNGTAAPLVGDALMPAHRKNLWPLTWALDNATLGKGSDYRQAFEVAFDLFEKTFERANIKSSCQNIIIHIGDGIDCVAGSQHACSVTGAGGQEEDAGAPRDGIQSILQAVERRQRQLEQVSSRAAIFTLTVRGGEDSLARQLACNNGGVWFRLDGRSEPLNNMAAYFQYLAFSMESHAEQANAPAIFSPLIIDFISIRDATTVVHPVFVQAKCANGTLSRRKVLLGVAGRVVTLRMLEEDGLKESQVKAMIDENLAEVRACNDGYKYSNCTMQAIRGTAAECPARSWTPGPTTKCYRFGAKRYSQHPNVTDFESAQKMCADLGGRLAELGGGDDHVNDDVDRIKEEQHFLASIAPPDGAWIGIRPEGNGWQWTGSLGEVPSSLQMRLWLKEPLKDTACRGGFIDPRGTMHNVGSRRCQEMTSFICEFNESMTQMPEACEGEITNVSPDTISSSTAEGCGLSDGCGKEERVATGVRDDVSTDPICDPGEPKSFTELTCCSQEEYKRLCPSQVMGNITSQEEAQGDAEGHTWCNTMKTLTALLVVTCALLVMVVLISMHKKKKLTILAWLRVHVLGRPDFTSRSLQLQQAPSSQLPPSRAAMAKTRAPNPTPDEYDAPNPAFPIVDIQNILPLEGGWEQPGAHGSVREGIWLDWNQRARKVAIKVARLPSSDDCVDAITKEFEILATLPPHPRIVWVIGMRLGECPMIVQELMAMNLGGALSVEAPGLTYLQILGIGLDVSRGMSHLHEHGVTHFGIKPSNILLDTEGRAKLADFTCSKLKMASTVCVAGCGTLGYIAPECLVGPSRTSQSLQEAAPETSPEPRGPVGEVPEEKVDIYSFGKVMLECVTGRLDVENEAAAKLCPGEVWELIGWCVSRDPKDRPSSEEVVGKLEGMLQCGGEWLGRSPRQDVWLAT